jgi:hypothetical protein
MKAIILRYEANSDPGCKRIWPGSEHWVYNKKGEELGAIARTKLWGRVRVAFETTDHGVYFTSDCLRTIAAFIDERETKERRRTGVQQAKAGRR